MTTAIRGSVRAYLRGAAQTLDLSGSTYDDHNSVESAAQADAIAIANDWRAVMGDLGSATDTVRRRCGR